jgi:HK97 family phage major capsid protein
VSDLSEIKELVEAQGEAWTQFKHKNDNRLSSLERDVGEILKSRNRPSIYSSDRDIEEPSAEHKAAWNRYLRKGTNTAELAAFEQKGMSEGSDPEGGYLAPAFMSSKIVKKIWDLSPIRQLARIQPVDSGNALEEIVDQDEAAAEWVGETQARNETTAPEVKLHRIECFEMHASPRATQRLIDDVTINLEQWLTDKVADKFARAEGDAFINGDGVSKPRGFTTYTTSSSGDSTRSWGEVQYIPSGASGDFASSNPADALIAMTEELRVPYRKNAVWVMSRAALKKVRQFKEATTNAYLLQPNIQQGMPPLLLGHQVFVDDNMPALAANSYSVAFGDFREAYCIADRTGIRMLRDPYTAKPHVVFYTTRRVGGGLSNSEALKLMKMAVS